MPNPRRPPRGACALLALLIVLPAMAQACDSEGDIARAGTSPYPHRPMHVVPADRAILSISKYPASHAATSNVVGGDGRDTFVVPDLRGRMVAGMGTGARLSPMARAQTPGQRRLALDASRAPLRAHRHTADVSPADKQATVDVPAAARALRIDAAPPISKTKRMTAAVVPAGKSCLADIGARVGRATAKRSGPATTTAPAEPSAAPTGPVRGSLPWRVTVPGAAPTRAASAPSIS